MVTPDHELPQPLNSSRSEDNIFAEGGERFPEVVPTGSLMFTNESNLGLPPRRRNVSESSLISEIDGHTSTYDVENEQLPPEPFYEPTFQAALRDGIIMANELYTELDSLRDHFEQNLDYERLYKDAKDLSEIQVSSTKTIAFLGDSGQG